MTKAQKIIILVAAVLFIMVGLFPPYNISRTDIDGNTILYKRLHPRYLDINMDRISSDWPIELDSPVDTGIQRIELIGLILLTVAAYVIAGPNKTSRMNGKQRAIVMITAILITAALFFRPVQYYKHGAGDIDEYIAADWISVFDWKFIINADNSVITTRVRYRVLFLEIFGILVLAGAGLLITKKRS